MYLTGFADEAGKDIDIQIRATRELDWRDIELRATAHGNIAEMSDAHFEELCGKLNEAGITVNCYGSGIANWAKSIFDPPDSSYDELITALPRLERLGTKLVRVMSFRCPEDASINTPEIEAEVIKRMKRLTEIAEGGGVVLVHENCDNWGGRSYEHTLRIMDAIDSPNFRLVFDTGNPCFRKDVRFGASDPFADQDAWEFYDNVKDYIEYIHIKDAVTQDGKTVFTMPGEGNGRVVDILTDLFRRGYDGGISSEPHLAVVFHDDSVACEADVMYANYVDYGKRLTKIVESIREKQHE
jgi:sugar phosphate isomerase/epimerase